MQLRLPSQFKRDADWLLSAALFLFTFSLYVRTLAPGVAEVFDDSLEFQVIAARTAIAHPTGYPLFSILLRLAAFLPVGDVAYRVNLVTAFWGALAVAGLYAVARQLLASRVAALAGALSFAFGQVFWSQAILAEVYTLHALLTTVMLWLTLQWGRGGRESGRQEGTETGSRLSILRRRSLVVLAFFFGLTLTHHRMSVLLLPGLVVYVLSLDRTVLREPRTLFRLVIAFIVPLLLYLYLPLVGLVASSLDGTYQNTPLGFFSWIMGSSYGVFLSQNPFREQRTASYFVDLFLQQFTWIGLGIAALGFYALARRAWREWLLLALGLAANFIFALSYRVADINVFFIPSFLFVALFVALGIDKLARLPAETLTNTRLYAPLAAVVLGASLLLPAWLLQKNLGRVDLSGKWDVIDQGRDLLSQPLPGNTTVIGLGGEMSLVHYFQDAHQLRPDVQAITADLESARLTAIENALEQNRAVFLTRPLRGAEKQYALASFGPWVQVQARPNKTNAPSPSHPLGEDFGNVTLLGYDLDTSRLNGSDTWHLGNGRQVRVTLYWHVEKKIGDDRLVSLKLLSSEGVRAAQLDRRPVLDAYPTTAWRAGEFISDSYDVPVLTGVAPGDYMLQVTLYDQESGQVYGQKELQQITLAPDLYDHAVPLADVDHLRQRAFGGFDLIGYSLDTTDPYTTDEGVPVTLLWRAKSAGAQLNLQLSLIRANGNTAASRTFSLDGSRVQPGQYLRQELSIPAKQAPPGAFTVELDLSPRGDLACELPFAPLTPCTLLGRVRLVSPK